MKKLLKRTGVALLTLVMLFSMIPAKETFAASNKQQTIAVNQTYSGSTLEGEKCLYTFTTPADGYFSVTVSDLSQKWNPISVAVLNSNNREVIDNTSIEDDTTGTTVCYASRGGKTYTVVVDPLNLEGAFNVQVNFVASNDWENEENGSAAQARVLSNNKAVYGTRGANDEYDYYRFSVKKNSKVKLTLGPKDVTGNSDSWSLDLIDSNNHTENISYSSSVVTTTVYLKKGTYYLRVHNFGAGEGVPYQVKYSASNLNVKKPTIKKVSIKKGKYSTYYYFNYLTMKGNKDVDGFQLQVAKKKNMKKKVLNQTYDINDYGTVGKKKISVNERLSTNKKYYTRVRGYVYDPFGAKIYGSYSKVKK